MKKTRPSRFDILRAFVGECPRSWDGTSHVVVDGKSIIFAPDGAWFGDPDTPGRLVYVTDHPGYLGRVEDVLGPDVVDRLMEIRSSIWEKL